MKLPPGSKKAGLFPWQEGFLAAWKFKQPLLDRNTDFKFYEERNVAVFTTRQVLEGAPILYVYHNEEDGAWQFRNSDNPDLNDAKIVALESVTKIGPSVNQVHCLPYGTSAYRKSPQDKWEY